MILIKIEEVLILNVRRLVIEVIVIEMLFFLSIYLSLFLIVDFDRDGVLVIFDININMLLMFIFKMIKKNLVYFLCI